MILWEVLQWGSGGKGLKEGGRGKEGEAWKEMGREEPRKGDEGGKDVGV